MSWATSARYWLQDYLRGTFEDHPSSAHSERADGQHDGDILIGHEFENALSQTLQVSPAQDDSAKARRIATILTATPGTRCNSTRRGCSCSTRSTSGCTRIPSVPSVSRPTSSLRHRLFRRDTGTRPPAHPMPPTGRGRMAPIRSRRRCPCACPDTSPRVVTGSSVLPRAAALLPGRPGTRHADQPARQSHQAASRHGTADARSPRRAADRADPDGLDHLDARRRPLRQLRPVARARRQVPGRGGGSIPTECARAAIIFLVLPDRIQRLRSTSDRDPAMDPPHAVLDRALSRPASCNLAGPHRILDLRRDLQREVGCVGRIRQLHRVRQRPRHVRRRSRSLASWILPSCARTRAHRRAAAEPPET